MNVRKIFDEKIEEIARLSDNVNWADKETYCHFLNQQYFLVQNSTRYLAMAASMVPVESSDEFRWWAHHLREELDHDKTILKDLKNLGWDKMETVSPEIRAMIGAQYYDLQKNGQDALLGYALMLEGLSLKCCTKIAETVEKCYGKKATYLRLHADVDQDHYPEGVARVETLPPERQAIIIRNLEMMAVLYRGFLNGVIEKSKPASKPKAA